MSSYCVFDSHCDTATEIWRREETLVNTSCQVSFPQMRMFEGCGQFFAFCTLSGTDKFYSCEQLLWEPYRYFLEQLQESDGVMLCTKGSDYDLSLQQGKIAAFLSLEGAEGINCDPGRLETLRQAGFTMVNLTWNRDNPLAGCSASDGGGLTKQGREFVKTAQKLGLIIDVSHISDRAFWDIMDIAEAPVVASHSNSRAICSHCRNLTDDQFRAICQSGGYVGINLYAAFLSAKRRVDFEDVYAHIDHFLQIGGEGHISLGGDLDGCDRMPDGFASMRDYEKLAAFLESKHYTEKTIQDIYSNTIKEVVTLCTM